MRNKILISLFLILTAYAYSQVIPTDPAGTTNELFKILELFGLVITDPWKALILFLIPIFVRLFERKALTDTIDEQNKILKATGFLEIKKKSLFRKLWEKIRFKKNNNE